MFVKIKLEPQGLKSLLKKISYFSIDDDATVMELKMNIEEFVDVPAERQEIRSLAQVLPNDVYVKEVCDVRGSAVMLYAYDECNEFLEPEFVCFLQAYTNELAAKQQELEQLSKQSPNNTNLTTPTSSISSVTLIASSDTDIDSEETNSHTSGSDLDSSADTSDSSHSKKRSKHEKKNTFQNKKLKVTATSESQYSETLCRYLDEFPNCSKQINSDNSATYKTNVVNENPNEQTASKILSPDNKKLNEDKIKKFENPNYEASSKGKAENINLTSIQSNLVTTSINNNSNNIHPCYSVSPEIRDYLAIISPVDVSTIGNKECEDLLAWFFDRFRTCESSNSLQFDHKTALALFDGKIWIACMNVNTFEWISTNIVKYFPKSYHVLTLKDSKHLCEVVVPMVSKSKHILEIFDLLEKQNKNITTLKWSLQSRQQLSVEENDFNEKAVSTFCVNELFKITIDTESKLCLEKFNFKLKYCFWQIVFTFF